MIYRHLLLGPRGLLTLPPTLKYPEGRAKLQVAILRTCRLVKEEATPILLENTLKLHWDNLAPPLFPDCQETDFDCETRTVPKYRAFWESDPFTSVTYQLRNRNVYLHKILFGFTPSAVFALFSKVEVDFNFKLRTDMELDDHHRTGAVLARWAQERLEYMFAGISPLGYLATLLERSTCLRELRLNIPVGIVPSAVCLYCDLYEGREEDCGDCEKIEDLLFGISCQVMGSLENDNYLGPLLRLRNCEKLLINTYHAGSAKYEEQVCRKVESNFQEFGRPVPLCLFSGKDVRLLRLLYRNSSC